VGKSRESGEPPRKERWGQNHIDYHHMNQPTLRELGGMLRTLSPQNRHLPQPCGSLNLPPGEVLVRREGGCGERGRKAGSLHVPNKESTDLFSRSHRLRAGTTLGGGGGRKKGGGNVVIGGKLENLPGA